MVVPHGATINHGISKAILVTHRVGCMVHIVLVRLLHLFRRAIALPGGSAAETNRLAALAYMRYELAVQTVDVSARIAHVCIEDHANTFDARDVLASGAQPSFAPQSQLCHSLALSRREKECILSVEDQQDLGTDLFADGSKGGLVYFPEAKLPLVGAGCNDRFLLHDSVTVDSIPEFSW